MQNLYNHAIISKQKPMAHYLKNFFWNLIEQTSKINDMAQENNLERFVDAHASSYKNALAEIKNGKKRTHWMWYIFPQIKGLGFSETSQFYALKNISEAEDYLNHPVLGSHLIEISNAALALENNNAKQIFGSPDDLKLKSSMTLFAAIPNADTVFQLVLNKFFKGTKDNQTLQIIGL